MERENNNEWIGVRIGTMRFSQRRGCWLVCSRIDPVRQRYRWRRVRRRRLTQDQIDIMEGFELTELRTSSGYSAATRAHGIC